VKTPGEIVENWYDGATYEPNSHIEGKAGDFEASVAQIQNDAITTSNLFHQGVVAMARNCLPVASALKDGRWTPDDMEKWLQAVITNDKGYLESVGEQLKQRDDL
jgi:hypothetical protein